MRHDNRWPIQNEVAGGYAEGILSPPWGAELSTQVGNVSPLRLPATGIIAKARWKVVAL